MCLGPFMTQKQTKLPWSHMLLRRYPQWRRDRSTRLAYPLSTGINPCLMCAPGQRVHPRVPNGN